MPFIVGGDHALMYPDVAAVADVYGEGKIGATPRPAGAVALTWPARIGTRWVGDRWFVDETCVKVLPPRVRRSGSGEAYEAVLGVEMISLST